MQSNERQNVNYNISKITDLLSISSNIITMIFNQLCTTFINRQLGSVVTLLKTYICIDNDSRTLVVPEL